MNSFEEVHWSCRRIVENLASQTQEEGTIAESTSYSGRGGSTINAVGEKMVIMFGGANREMAHFSDVWVFDSPLEKEKDSTDVARLIQVTGDIPGERSGHATASFGRFVFLFGGINFAEESVYNDLYILNTDTWEWSYVGEKGEQIRERNSHSLDILDYGPNGKYLFLYGGASPEKGVFRDAFYARLPDTDSEIVSDMASFYVEWIKLAESARGASPGDREMHGTCVVGGNELIVLGGRNEKGDMFDDAWKLVLQTSNDSHSPETLFIWNKMESMNLPFKCCAHTLNVISSGTDGMECLCLFGGFQDRKGDVGISNDIYSYSLSPSSSSVCWKEISYEGLPVSRRFGHCSTEIYREDPKSIAVIIFGGVKEDEDLSDIWIIEDNFST